MRESVRAALLLVILLLGGACDPGDFDDRPRPGDGGRELDANLHDSTDAAPPGHGELDAASHDGGANSVLRDAASDASFSAGDAGDAGNLCLRADRKIVVTRAPVQLARMAKSPVFSSRVLGPTMRLGDSDHVWTFSSARRLETIAAPALTPVNHPYIAFDGAVQPWKTSPGGASWVLREPASGAQLPPTVLPLRAGESAQTTLLPVSSFRIGGETQGHLFSLQYDGLSLTPSKVWHATLPDSSTLAARPPLPLFSAPPLFAYGARIDDVYLSIYACSAATSTTPSRCVAGRAPIAMMDQPSAYQVRGLNAKGVMDWLNDLSAGVPVLENVNNDLTISYNAYLQSFLAIYGEPLSNEVVLRTSATPYGPWSEPVRVALPAPAALTNVSIHEHPSLAQMCERRVVISYFAPSTASGIFATTGEIVLSAIDLD